MPGEANTYIVTVYPARGLPPERMEFTDKLKAEKAFADAAGAVILWEARSVAGGLGWVKLQEKGTV